MMPTESKTLKLSPRDGALFLGMQTVELPADFLRKSRMALILWLEQRRPKMDFECEVLAALRRGDRHYKGGSARGAAESLSYHYGMICPTCGDAMIDGTYGAFCWHCDE